MLYELITELTHQQILKKQRNITSLFPTFKARVDKVEDAGGIRLVDMVHSTGD